jgi:hypothetical protein
MKKFDLLHQYQAYLNRVDLDETKMSQIQAIEMKRCFMGACGQMLVLLHDDWLTLMKT